MISVPTDFRYERYPSIRSAANLAGFDPYTHIFYRSQMSTFAYHFHHSEDPNILIYHLGGQTLDISIVNVNGDYISILENQSDQNLGNKKRYVNNEIHNIGAEIMFKMFTTQNNNKTFQ
jgi:molecular chaperone DnaK (HSP70)